MRKSSLLALLVSLAVLTIVAGCGNKQGTTTDSSVGNKNTPPSNSAPSKK